VSDGGPRRRAAHELVLSLSLSTSQRPLRLPLPQDWFHALYRRGMAAHEGFLVLKTVETQSAGCGGDFVFYRCRPAEARFRPLAFERERVAVAREPAGGFRVVRREFWG
jgi:hypothetical protein